MFEFEGKGSIEDLKKTEKELLEHLGFEAPVSIDYEQACRKYGVETIGDKEEEKTKIDFGTSVSLEIFPKRSHPFWNMKYLGNNLFNKVDVLLYGMETIGSAERACDPDEMLKFFNIVSNGDYKKLLFNKFTEERVMEELDFYLSLPMIPRYGAGIGMTRMERAMKLAGLLGEETKQRILERVA